MDHSVEFKNLVDSLIHRCESLENHPKQDREAALDALAELDLLSSLTVDSLAAITPPPPPPEAVRAALMPPPKASRKANAEAAQGLPAKITPSRVRAAVNGRPTAATTSPTELARALSRISGAASAAAASLQQPSAPASPRTRAPAAPKVAVPEKYSNTPALQDSSVLNALMEFHAQHAPARAAKPASPTAPGNTPLNAQTGTRTGARNPTALPQFRPAEIPVVGDIHHKEASRLQYRAAEPTSTVLRGKPSRS